MNYNLRHLQPVPPIKIGFAVILFFFSIYLFYSGTYFGLILLGAALKLALREGVEINLQEKKYRQIYSIFALNFGIWQPLPEIEYISVFKTKKNKRARVISAEASLAFTVYKVNLFYNRNKHLEIYYSDEVEDSFKVAKHISYALELEIWDATKEDQDWYDPSK